MADLANRVFASIKAPRNVSDFDKESISPPRRTPP